MDKKLLLIQAITLLFRESQLENNGLDSSSIVRPIAESVALPDVSIGLIDTERDLLIGLKKICLDMCDNTSYKFDATDLMQKVKYICRDDDVLYNSFAEGVSTEKDQDQLKKLCLSIRRTFKNHDRETKIQEVIQKAAAKLKFNRDEIPDIQKFVADINTELEPYRGNGEDIDPAIVNTADFDDIDGVVKIMEASKELNDDKGIMRTGFQGINRMLQGGIRRGETIVCAALQHNFKTGFTLSLFKQIALHNKPYMIDEKKKPMLLHISFENSLELNMPFLYRNIYENETKQQADLNKTAPEMAQYIREKMQVNGYEIRFVHVNPSLWTYMDICNYITALEAEGYEIHLLMVDYLNMIPKTGCDNTGPQGSNIRDLFRRMRNFCAP